MTELKQSDLRSREESLLKRVAPVFTVISALVAVIALVYNPSLRSRGLTSTYLGGDNIVRVQRDAAPGDLQVLYQGKRIDALYSLKVAIKNTGSSSIKDSDVKEPLVLVFPRGYSLVDEPVVQTKPSFQFSAVVDAQNANTVHISFPLMNGGDEVFLNFKAVAIGSAAPFLSGRVVDVKQISNIDLSKSRPDNKTISRISAALVWSLTILNGLLGSLSIIFFGFATKQFVGDRIWKRKWHSKLRDATEKAIAENRALTEKSTSAGKMITYLDAVGIEEHTRLKEGIPQKPGGLETWKEYLAFGASFLLLATVFGPTTYVLIAGAIF